MADSGYPNPTWRYWWGTVNLVVAGHDSDPSQFTSQLKTLLSRTGTTTPNSWQSHGNWIFAACKIYNSDKISKIDHCGSNHHRNSSNNMPCKVHSLRYCSPSSCLSRYRWRTRQMRVRST